MRFGTSHSTSTHTVLTLYSKQLQGHLHYIMDSDMVLLMLNDLLAVMGGSVVYMPGIYFIFTYH